MAEKKETTELMTVKYQLDGKEIKLTPNIVKEYIVGDAAAKITNQEFKLFTELCVVRKLNPFLKEAYLIKYGTAPAQIVVGKDAILKRAILNKKFNGRKQGIIVQKKDGSIEQRTGTFKLSDEILIGGWATVYRKDWEHPVEITVAFDEVAQKKSNGELNSNWANKGATMVEKVALVRALREAFVEDLGGMIDADEKWDNDSLIEIKQTISKNANKQEISFTDAEEVAETPATESESIKPDDKTPIEKKNEEDQPAETKNPQQGEVFPRQQSANHLSF